MRRLTLTALLGAVIPTTLLSCGINDFQAMSIRPIYGYVDGCTAVEIGGRNFGDDVSVTIGGKALQDQSLPDAATEELLVGFEVRGTTPPGDAVGYASVVVSTGGEEMEVWGGKDPQGEDRGIFYYEACPADPNIEAIGPLEGLSAGDTVAMTGCNLKDSYTVRVGTADAVSIQSDCSSAQTHIDAPSLDDGTYYIAILDGSGNELYPANGCDTTQPFGSGSGDTADTGGDPCDAVLTFTYGGGR